MESETEIQNSVSVIGLVLTAMRECDKFGCAGSEGLSSKVTITQ